MAKYSFLGILFKEACNFSNDSCWGVTIQGKTAFSYLPFDLLKLFQESVGLDDECIVENCNFLTFEELYESFLKRIKQHVESFHEHADLCFFSRKKARCEWFGHLNPELIAWNQRLLLNYSVKLIYLNYPMVRHCTEGSSCFSQRRERGGI